MTCHILIYTNNNNNKINTKTNKTIKVAFLIELLIIGKKNNYKFYGRDLFTFLHQEFRNKKVKL